MLHTNVTRPNSRLAATTRAYRRFTLRCACWLGGLYALLMLPVLLSGVYRIPTSDDLLRAVPAALDSYIHLLMPAILGVILATVVLLLPLLAGALISLCIPDGTLTIEQRLFWFVAGIELLAAYYVSLPLPLVILTVVMD